MGGSPVGRARCARALAIGVVLAGLCAPGVTRAEDARAFAGVAPHATLVNRVAGGGDFCRSLVPPGADPHTYSPAPSIVRALSGATLYFKTGLPLEESWVPRVRAANARLRIVDLRAGIRLREMEGQCCAHDHGHEGDPHAHGGAGAAGDAPRFPDPHIWLSPPLLKIQAGAIRDALIAAEPEGRAVFEANCAALHAELDVLHAGLGSLLGPFKGRAILVYHPAYGYFTDAYGLRQEAIEVAGREPTPQGLTSIIERARGLRVGAVFVQPRLDRRSASAVGRALRLPLVALDDLASDPVANLRSMGQAIRDSMGDAP